MPEQQRYLSTDPNDGEPVRPAAQSRYLSEDPDEGEPLRVRSRGERFVEGFAQNVLPSTRAADYIEGPLYALQHPIDSIGLLLDAALTAHVTQGKKAWERGTEVVSSPTLGGKLRAGTEMLGHTAAAVMPLVGPAAANAGERIGEGDIAGGLGAAAGVLSPMATKPIARPIKAAVADKAHASALRGVERAINPTRADTKVQTTRIAPEILERRVSARSLPKLEELAETKSAAAGAKVDEALGPHKDVTADTMTIVDELEKAKEPYTGKAQDGSTVVNDKQRVKAISNLQDTLMEYGDDISVESMVKLRRNWDQVVEAGKGFTTEKPKVRAWAAREGRAALRDELSKAVPDLDKVNAEYAFWQTLEDVAHASNERKTGQKGNLVSSVAGGAGAVAAEVAMPGSGIVKGGLQAAIGAKVFSSVRKLIDSPGYQLWTAVQKERLADALMAKDTTRIQGLVHAGMVATSKSSRAAGRLQSGRPAPAAAELRSPRATQQLSGRENRQ